MKVSVVVGYVVVHIFYIDGKVRGLVIWLVMWKIYMHMATILIAVMATEPLKEPFGVAKHKVVNKVEDGNQQQFLHIQQMIVGILHQVKEGHSRSKSMDWMDICLIPKLKRYNNSKNCEEWWDESETNLWTDWDSLEVETTMAWQYSITRNSAWKIGQEATGSRIFCTRPHLTI